MRKRKLCMVLIFSFLLTGCSGRELTKAESGQVAEYMAYTLLKYNDDPGILSVKTPVSSEPVKVSVKLETPNEQDKTPVPSQTVTPSKNPVHTETVGHVANAGEIFGDSALNVSIHNGGFYHSYSGSENDRVFSLTAASGKKLLILNVTLENTKDSSVRLDTSNAVIEYRLNGESDRKSLTTLLENDIHFVRTTLDSEKRTKAVLVFEVPKDYQNSDVKEVKMVKGKSGTTVTIPIK